MKLSQLFNLEATQFELDFIDIDPDVDQPLFLDPYFLGLRGDRFSIDASRAVRNFFETFIGALTDGRDDEARGLLDHLEEPNETCLGMSVGSPRGRGVNRTDADRMFESIRGSRAVQTGLVERLEDIRIFVRGVDKDKVSDMATNIIRSHLHRYTVQQCRLWELPLTPGIQVGYGWDAQRRRWGTIEGETLVINGRRILLVPKSIVSFAKRYTPERFYRHYLLTYKQHEHLRLGTALVQYRRNKARTPFVTKRDVAIESPFDKDRLADFVRANREVFVRFKRDSEAQQQSLTNEQIAQEIDLARVLTHLLAELAETAPGNAGAIRYQRVMSAIFELIFYPVLTCPQLEASIDDGRRRVDIVFDNAAREGVFHRIQHTFNLPCPYIFIECKNYSEDIGNPELDQLAGRFTPNRGRVGFSVSRQAEDLNALLARCNDIYTGDRGLILPLLDADIEEILRGMLGGTGDIAEQVLSRRLRQVTLV